MTGGNRHQRRHSEYGNDRAVGGGLGIADRLAEEAAEIVVTADALAADEGLRRLPDRALPRESVGFFARLQPMILDLIPLSAQQILGLETLKADLIRNHRPI